MHCSKLCEGLKHNAANAFTLLLRHYFACLLEFLSKISFIVCQCSEQVVQLNCFGPFYAFYTKCLVIGNKEDHC